MIDCLPRGKVPKGLKCEFHPIENFYFKQYEMRWRSPILKAEERQRAEVVFKEEGISYSLDERIVWISCDLYQDMSRIKKLTRRIVDETIMSRLNRGQPVRCSDEPVTEQ